MGGGSGDVSVGATEVAVSAARLDLLEAIRRSVIGADAVLQGPFGCRRIVYADYTASGRALTFVEDFIRDSVLPYYANTHTRATTTGRHTTALREEARSVIREAVGGSAEHAVLFCGSGATGAIDRLVGILGWRGTSVAPPPAERPVVFVGPYEHHSNELPWRESVADVVVIGEDATGHIDLDQLAAELERHRDRELKLGSFSAASNVTGILTDTAAVATLLHAHGALACFDYAAAAPYVDIEMGAGDDPAHKDAIFISPHKLPGGPGSPGVLVLRRELVTAPVPAVAGGGTVRYVSATGHRYHDDPEAREEAGTPDIVGSIRAGLAFQLKGMVGAEAIDARERRLVRTAIARWSAHPGIELLGNAEADRLAIVSFNLRHGDELLHHNYVVALLNDLFGIQARGGLSCAGPYGDRLLRVDAEQARAYQQAIDAGHAGIRPGWIRLNFNYFIGDATLRFILDAVELVAERGHALLGRYRFDLASGTWTNRDAPPPAPPSLRDLDPCASPAAVVAPSAPGHDECLAEARRILAAATAGRPGTLEPALEPLRWFALSADGGG